MEAENETVRLRLAFNNTRIMGLHASSEEEDGINTDCFYGGVLTKITVCVLRAIIFSVTSNFIFRKLLFSH
jgi:hypothetical protein